MTLIFFFAQEFIAHILAYVEGLLLAYGLQTWTHNIRVHYLAEFILDLTTSIYFSAATILGCIVRFLIRFHFNNSYTEAYAAVYRYNMRELDRMRVKSIMDTYSVSRTYQIKENLALLRVSSSNREIHLHSAKLFTKIAIPLMLTFIPAYTFYFLYGLIEPQNGFDTLRYLSIAMFDLWLSMSACTHHFRTNFLKLQILRFGSFLYSSSREEDCTISSREEHRETVSLFFRQSSCCHGCLFHYVD